MSTNPHSWDSFTCFSYEDGALQEVPASEEKPNTSSLLKASRKTHSCGNIGTVSKHVIKHKVRDVMSWSLIFFSLQTQVVFVVLVFYVARLIPKHVALKTWPCCSVLMKILQEIILPSGPSPQAKVKSQSSYVLVVCLTVSSWKERIWASQRHWVQFNTQKRFRGM